MLSSASKYALQIVIYLANNRKVGKIRAEEIAKRLHLAAPYAGKVLQPLSHSGILSSTKGPNGGFSIGKEPDKITLLEIIEIFEGEEVLRSCVMTSCACSNYENGQEECKVHSAISPGREQLLDSLRNRTVADFLVDSEILNLNMS